MLQMTAQDLRAFETQLEIKAARGNCLARETQTKLQALPNDAARIEYLRGFVERAQRAVFWVKGFVLKWEIKNKRQRSKKSGKSSMEIQHGEKLFEFKSKTDWINQAQRIWRFHGVLAQDIICVDQLGRICGWGKHFADAERDNAYPIEVFRLRTDMNQSKLESN